MDMIYLLSLIRRWRHEHKLDSSLKKAQETVKMLQDVDMLTVADFWRGKDPEELILQVERERNARLARRGIPNDIEDLGKGWHKS